VDADDCLRVGITVGPRGHGGIATYSRELIQALARRSDIDLVLVGDRECLDETRSLIGGDGSADVDVAGQRVVSQFKVAMLKGSLSKRDLDVMHVTQLVAPLRWSGPVAMTFHDDYPLTRRADYDTAKRWLLPPIFRRSIRRAEAIVTLDRNMVDKARTLVPPEIPITDAGAAVSTSLTTVTAVRPANATDVGRFAIVVGDAGPRKRVDRLLSHWRSVTEQCGVHLVIVGGRSADSRLLAMIADTPLVTLLCDVDDAGLAWLYRNTVLVLDPSDDEGFGFPRVEAEHFSAPYLALRNANSSLDWAAVVVHACERPPIVDGRTGEMSWDDVARRTVGVYRDAIERHG
jgi:glycosyltransferase involved in cell wall biosynthesis